MKDHVKIGHLTKYDALWVNGVMNLEIRFKIHTNVSKFDKASPKNHINSNFFFYFFISLVTTVKSYHVPTI